MPKEKFKEENNRKLPNLVNRVIIMVAIALNSNKRLHFLNSSFIKNASVQKSRKIYPRARKQKGKEKRERD
ncbi:MAG: hypothetical protein GF308_12080 [Candidatus Heimdallarchaeota archaeon]|nr:hypothetical protein [Candidatus Heimdallarchaeota archaeon]